MTTEAIDEILRALAYAPPAEGQPIQEGLLGWRTPDNHFLCARCAARLIARGVSIPRPCAPVWHDSPEPHGICIGHPHQ